MDYHAVVVKEAAVMTLVVVNAGQLPKGISPRHVFDNQGGSVGAAHTDSWQLFDREGFILPCHFRIQCIDGNLCLTQLAQQLVINNARLPAGRIQPVRLKANDLIELGGFQIKVFAGRYEQVMVNADVWEEESVLLVSKDEQQAALWDQPIRKTHVDPLQVLDPRDGVEPGWLPYSNPWQSQPVTVNSDSEDCIMAAVATGRIVSGQDRYSQQRHEKAEKTSEQGRHTGSYQPEKHWAKEEPTLQDNDHRPMGSAYSQPAGGYDEAAMDEPSYFDGAHCASDHTEGNHLVTGPLLRGLGYRVSEQHDLTEMHALSQEIGAALQASVRGLLTLHQQVTTSRYGGMNKNLQPIEDNPLRLGMNYEDTIETLFEIERSDVHLSAPAAISESLETVRHHNQAVEEAISEALQQILFALSPDVLMRRFRSYRRTGQPMNESPETWAWKMYQSYYKEMASNRQHGFEKLFWEIFEQAYDRSLRRIQQEV